jgi:PAS domain S-box-containing protein
MTIAEEIELLRRSVILAGVGSWEFDIESNTIKWDDVMFEVHHLPRTFEVTHANIIALYKSGAEQLAIAYESAIKTGTPWELELEMETPRGKRWVRSLGRAHFEQGRCTKLYGATMDIDNQKRAEQTLRASEERFRSLIYNNSDIISLIDAKGTMLYQSASLTQTMQWSENELAGKNFFSLIHPDDVPHVMELFKTFISKPGLGPTVRFRLADKKQGYIHIEARGNNQLANPHINALVVNSRDITETIRAEQELAESLALAQVLSKYYESIVENKSFYVVKIDLQGNFTFANNHYKNVFGSDDEQMNLSSFEGLGSDEHKVLKEVFQQCILKPSVPQVCIIRRTDNEGNLISIKWELNALQQEDGSVLEVQGIGFDVTEQVETLKETKRLLEVTTVQNSKLRSFAHIISHNIRNHSANLSGLVELLMDSSVEEEKGAYTQLIKASADNLEKTILDLNKIISINQESGVPKETRSLRSEIYKTIQIFSLKILKLDAELKIEVDPKFNVRVIPSFLDSVLLNLIDNAFKYRSDERKIILTLNAHVEGDYIVLSITDNGKGIDLKQHGGKVFGLYKTFHGNRDARGMGLYIVKSQMEDMGGKIELESEVNVGTTFKVYFKKGLN